MIGLTAFAPSLSTEQQSGSIPSVIRKTVEFTDRGRTYLVNTETGTVTYVDQGQPEPQPEPPKPPPEPQSLRSDVRNAFVLAIPGSRRKEAAGALWHAIEVTLAEAGGLGYDAQKIIDELKNNADFVAGDKIKGFDLGSVFQKHGVESRDEVIKALKETMSALEPLK